MKIADLQKMAENRMAHLQSNRTAAERLGDVEHINRLNAEIDETANTLSILQQAMSLNTA
jgi:phosphate uptake regulator